MTLMSNTHQQLHHSEKNINNDEDGGLLTFTWKLSSWTHLTEKVLSCQTPCSTAKEVSPNGTIDLITTESHKLNSSCW
jgi:hypothetical protein